MGEVDAGAADSRGGAVKIDLKKDRKDLYRPPAAEFTEMVAPLRVRPV